MAEQFGPEYNIDSPSLRKFRRSGGISKAYGEEVLKVVRAKISSECRRAFGESMPASRCASGTWHQTGEAILKAVRDKQNRALLACPESERRARTPQKWREMYEAAMREKEERVHGNSHDQQAKRDATQRPTRKLHSGKKVSRGGHKAAVQRVAARARLSGRQHPPSNARARGALQEPTSGVS